MFELMVKDEVLSVAGQFDKETDGEQGCIRGDHCLREIG